MTTSVPEGYHTVTPWVVTPDTGRLIDFATRAFDAHELARIVDDRGVVGHAEVRIGDSVVMAFDTSAGWPSTPRLLRLYVDDADATFARAIVAGGTSVTEVTHLFWGDRVGRVADPLGNIWWIQAHGEDVEPDEIGRRVNDPEWLQRMASSRRRPHPPLDECSQAFAASTSRSLAAKASGSPVWPYSPPRNPP